MQSNHYKLRDGKIYWRNDLVRGADADSFEPLGDTCARDKNHVYVLNGRQNGADANTFCVLNAIFAKDGEHVYYIDGKASKIADPKTFEVLDLGNYLASDGGTRFVGYARDSSNVYFHDMNEGVPKPVKGAAPSSFRVLGRGFGIDRENVFWMGRRVKGADGLSFKRLDGGYSVDDAQAYYLSNMGGQRSWREEAV